MCALRFFEDQATADVPYVPPESAKEHAVYLWTAEEMEKNSGGVVKMSGKELLFGSRWQPQLLWAEI